MDNLDANSNLINDLKQGKEIALSRLFDIYADDVYALGFRILKDASECEDIVQEVFIKVWNARQKLDTNGHLWSYLYVLTKRLALNKLRKLHHRSIAVALTDENLDILWDKGADYLTNTREIQDLENSILYSLTKQQQQVYLLSRSEGLSYKEIAERLNIAPNTVKNHVVQTLKRFRSTFQKLGYPTLLFFLIFF